MSLQKKILNEFILHRRGIMGTAIFHLLAGIFMISMELKKVNTHTEMEIVFEAPEPEEIKRKEEEEMKKEEVRQKSAAEEVEKMLRSIAVNENVNEKQAKKEVKVQEYVEEILEELRESEDEGRYKAQRDRNYKADSLQYSKDRKEQELDSLKSVFYSGESSVSYNLKDRYARFLPIPVFKCEVGGKVVVEILVNQKGVVQRATVVESESHSDDCLWQVAADAARRSRFNEKPSAPSLQRGTITYHFVRQ